MAFQENYFFTSTLYFTSLSDKEQIFTPGSKDIQYLEMKTYPSTEKSNAGF